MGYVFNESYLVLRDILSMSAKMFHKGIVDANLYYNREDVDSLAYRSEVEHYTTLMLIIEDKVCTLDERQYLNVIRAVASEHELFAYRNFTIRSDSKVISATCTLFDYCYRQGVARTNMFDKSRISTMLKTMRDGKSSFFTPKGVMKERQWLDEVRKYITIIELDLSMNGYTNQAKKMALLDKYLAAAMKMRAEIETSEQIENERRKFILSGGEI